MVNNSYNVSVNEFNTYNVFITLQYSFLSFNFFYYVQVKQQNSTSAKVAQMFDLVFDPKTDKEQRLQVHNHININVF